MWELSIGPTCAVTIGWHGLSCIGAPRTVSRLVHDHLVRRRNCLGRGYRPGRAGRLRLGTVHSRSRHLLVPRLLEVAPVRVVPLAAGRFRRSKNCAPALHAGSEEPLIGLFLSTARESLCRPSSEAPPAECRRSGPRPFSQRQGRTFHGHAQGHAHCGRTPRQRGSICRRDDHPTPAHAYTLARGPTDIEGSNAGLPIGRARRRLHPFGRLLRREYRSTSPIRIECG